MAKKGCKKEMWENKMEMLDCRMEMLENTKEKLENRMVKLANNWDLPVNIRLMENWGNNQETSANKTDLPVTWKESWA